MYIYSIYNTSTHRAWKKIFCYWPLKAPLCHVIIAQLRDANVGLAVTSLLATLAVVY